MTSEKWLMLAMLTAVALAGCGSPAKHQDDAPPQTVPPQTVPSQTVPPPITPISQRQPPPTPEPVDIKQVHAEVFNTGSGTTPGGVKYEDVRPGTGAVAKTGDTVFVHYTGWLASNRDCFDSSAGKEPFRFTLGQGAVIKGWDEGVVGMRVSGKRLLTIPAKLAYGEQGAGGRIPPNADLLFEVELLDVIN